MEKYLFILRHAKSSWDYPDLDDFHRPLNKRGLRDAPKMARIFAERFGSVDLWLTSPAIRALSTAVFHASAGLKSYDRIRIDPRIYAAEHSTLIQVLRELPEKFQTVAVFGHNPGLSDLVRELSGLPQEDLPTLGTARLQIEGSWEDLSPGGSTLTDRLEPKALV